MDVHSSRLLAERRLKITIFDNYVAYGGSHSCDPGPGPAGFPPARRRGRVECRFERNTGCLMAETDRWLDDYGASHRNITHAPVYWLSVFVVVFGTVGLLWVLPVPDEFLEISPLLNWGIRLPAGVVGLLFHHLAAACLWHVAFCRLHRGLPSVATILAVFRVARVTWARAWRADRGCISATTETAV